MNTEINETSLTIMGFHSLLTLTGKKIFMCDEVREFNIITQLKDYQWLITFENNDGNNTLVGQPVNDIQDIYDFYNYVFGHKLESMPTIN